MRQSRFTPVRRQQVADALSVASLFVLLGVMLHLPF